MSRVLPILFNTEMVQAILDGGKTVTRRVIKRDITNKCDVDTDGTLLCYEDEYGDHILPEKLCQYQPGDILYVRETWSPVFVKPKRYLYKVGCDEANNLPIKWKPSIHMPKEAARIWLKVTDVRVERLQDIMKDAPGPNNQIVKEGCKYGCDFIALWESTIKKSERDLYGWDANPWVWVIEFERCEKPKEL